MRSSWTVCATAVGLLLLGQPDRAHATEIGNGHPFGLGLALGYPAGITGKYYLGGRKNAIEGLLATWAYHGGWGSGGWYLHGVYMWHPSVLTTQPGFELPWHVGVGGFLAEDYHGYDNWWSDDVEIGGRVQIGLDFDLTDVRLQFSLDAALNVGLFPHIPLFGIHPTVSGRYYF